LSSSQLASACRAAILTALVMVAAACAPTTSAAPEAVPATATTAPTSTVPPPSSSTTPPTTIKRVAMPTLVGMTMPAARRALAARGLRSTVRYASTGRFRAGTVVSQTHGAGRGVLPGTAVGLVVAKAPPPPPPRTSPAPAPPPPRAPPSNCDPSYPGTCLRTGIGDYDCAGGSGNGPNYVDGPVRVRPPDPFDLDRDGDGVGCES
jgi:PASTA domain